MTLSANTYQQLAARTLVDAPPRSYTDQEIMLVWCGMGVGGEGGEVADSIKKMVFHDKGIDVPKLMDELGDVLWYIAGVCSVVGTTLEDVMTMNVEKLKARYPQGFVAGGGIREGCAPQREPRT